MGRKVISGNPDGNCPRAKTVAEETRDNTSAVNRLADITERESGLVIESNSEVIRQMATLRKLQSEDLDRELRGMQLTREEMEAGRHALNRNTEAMNRLAAALEARK